MAKYHINPKTGNAGACRADNKCPFGGEDKHYASKSEARAAYEKTAETEVTSFIERKQIQIITEATWENWKTMPSGSQTKSYGNTSGFVAAPRYRGGKFLAYGQGYDTSVDGPGPEKFDTEDEASAFVVDSFNKFLVERYPNSEEAKKISASTSPAPVFEGKSSVRFYGNNSPADLAKAANRMNEIFSHNPQARIKLSDRWGSATGVKFIGYDEASKEYFLGKSRMRIVEKYNSSTDLKKIVKLAADETGYEDSEYDLQDWDA